jgi:hypothetical protein
MTLRTTKTGGRVLWERKTASTNNEAIIVSDRGVALVHSTVYEFARMHGGKYDRHPNGDVIMVRRPITTGSSLTKSKNGLGMRQWAWSKGIAKRCSPDGKTVHPATNVIDAMLALKVSGGDEPWSILCEALASFGAEPHPLHACYPMLKYCKSTDDDPWRERYRHPIARYSDPRTAATVMYRTDYKPFIRALAHQTELGNLDAFAYLCRMFKGLVPIEHLSSALLAWAGNARPGVMPRGWLGRRIMAHYGPARRKILLNEIANEQMWAIRDLPTTRSVSWETLRTLLPERPQTLTDLHDTVWQSVNTARQQQRHLTMSKSYEYSERVARLNGLKVGEYTIVLPEHNNRLADMGNELNNCMAGYDYEIRNGSTVLGTIELDGRPIIGFELEGLNFNSGWAIYQFLRRANKLEQDDLALMLRFIDVVSAAVELPYKWNEYSGSLVPRSMSAWPKEVLPRYEPPVEGELFL